MQLLFSILGLISLLLFKNIGFGMDICNILVSVFKAFLHEKWQRAEVYSETVGYTRITDPMQQNFITQGRNVTEVNVQGGAH